MSVDECRSSSHQERDEHLDDGGDFLKTGSLRLEGLVEVELGWIDVISFEVIGDVDGERRRFGEGVGDQFRILDAESEDVVAENDRFRSALSRSSRLVRDLGARRSSSGVPRRNSGEIILDSSQFSHRSLRRPLHHFPHQAFLARSAVRHFRFARDMVEGKD